MAGERHRVLQGDALPAGFGDKPRAQGVRSKVAFELRKRHPALDDERDRLAGQRAAGAGLVYSPKDRPRGHPGGGEPRGERRGGGADHGFHGLRLGPGAGLLRLRMRKAIEVSGLVDLLEVLYGSGRDFRASASAGGEGEEEEGAIANALQPVRAGGEQVGEGISGERRFRRRPHPTGGVTATDAPHELLHGRVAHRIGELAQLVGLGEHREAVQHGVERRGAALGFEAARNERRIDRGRQIVLERTVLGRPLHVIDEKLQHDGHRDGQRQGRSIAQVKPRCPVAQRARIAAHRVRRFAFPEQGRDRGPGLGVQHLRVERVHGRVQHEAPGPGGAPRRGRCTVAALWHTYRRICEIYILNQLLFTITISYRESLYDRAGHQVTTASQAEGKPASRHHSDEPYESVSTVASHKSTTDTSPDEEETSPERPEAGTQRARRLSAAEVFATADALLVEGHRPTIDRVRVRLGRGSPNTINEHLDTWWRQLGARIRDLPGQEFPQLPERVAHTLQLLWNEALKGAHEVLREAVTAREATLQQREDALTASKRQLQEERQALAARGSALEESLALARTQLVESNQRAGALEQALRERDESLASAQRRLEQLETQAANLADRLEAEQKARLAERVKFDERYDIAETRWLMEVDQTRERLKTGEKQARADAAERARLHDELQRAKCEALEAGHELKTARVVNGELRERIKAFGDRVRARAGRRRKSRLPQRTASARKRKNKPQ